ncbi:hypothetical protein ACIQZB_27305 [Streptomyces sp. NPDC097727]|uniref:hypothetical protein n=1 Tax=Streptomyces sp. NPDC097727 TaxID=3366092 RepID=UPI0037FFC0C9
MRRDGQAAVLAGRPALPVSTPTFLYGAGMAVDPPWPWAAVYDPAGGHWYFQRFTLLPLGATVLLGAVHLGCGRRASSVR